MQQSTVRIMAKMEFAEVIFICKFVLCVLMTQLGKTFTAISRIQTELDQDDEHGKSIHVIFTMNTLKNNDQFSKRLQKIEERYGKGSVVVFSSKYSGKYKHVTSREHLQGLCLDEATCPRIIVMCSNKVRFDDGIEFIRVIERNNTLIARVYAYYDELHKYISQLRLHIEEIHKMNVVKGIVGLTATPKDIWKRHETGFWSKIRVNDMNVFNDEGYAGFHDMDFICIDSYFTSPYKQSGSIDLKSLESETLGFIKHVLDKHPLILNDKSRLFIPAHVRQSSHIAVQDLVLERRKDAVVVVINGREKVVRFILEDELHTVPVDDGGDGELSDQVSQIIQQRGLMDRPLVYTGFYCIGMGQTLTNELLGSFTGAIIGHLDLTNDDIYQLFGRVTGRTKKWKSYYRTKVYCPTLIMHRVKVMEECARRMATDCDGDYATVDDYEKPIHEMKEGHAVLSNQRPEKKEKKVRLPNTNHIVHSDSYRVFDNFATMKSYCEMIGRKKIHNLKDADKTESGFYKVGLNKEKEVASLEKAIAKVSSAYGGGKQSGTRTYYVCYKDLKNPDSIRFVAILPKDLPRSQIESADTKYPQVT